MLTDKLTRCLRLALLVLLISLLGACSKDPVYKTGVYEAEANGRNGPVRLSVTIDSDGKISRIDVIKHQETTDIMNNVSSGLSQEIIKLQDARVDTLAGATETSQAYVEAVKDALDQAR